jgi:hypothetical protein
LAGIFRTHVLLTPQAQIARRIQQGRRVPGALRFFVNPTDRFAPPGEFLTFADPLVFGEVRTGPHFFKEKIEKVEKDPSMR